MWFSKKRDQQPEPTTASTVSETEPTSNSARDWLCKAIARVSRDHLPLASIDVHAHLLDSGYVDSLSSTELLADIERRFGVRIDEMDIVGRLCNIEALAREIESRASGTGK
jgi:acyl carrier protein